MIVSTERNGKNLHTQKHQKKRRHIKIVYYYQDTNSELQFMTSTRINNVKSCLVVNDRLQVWWGGVRQQSLQVFKQEDKVNRENITLQHLRCYKNICLFTS